MKGAPKGYKHTWLYSHNATSDNGRNFRIYQTKRRARPAASQGTFTIGSRIKWGLKGTEYVTKRGGRTIHRIIAYKKPLKWHIKRTKP